MKSAKEKTEESIMHMVVNFGEQSNYPQQIKHEFEDFLFYSCMVTKREVAIEYFKAKLALEVYTHHEEYTQFITSEAGTYAEQLAELVKDFQDTFTSNI